MWIAPVAVAGYFLFFFRLTGMGLIGPDEPRYAWIGREMARSGDWVTPRLWGKPWFEKPALDYWMTAAAFRLGLDPDAAPRLPVACWSVAFLAFFYWRMRVEFGAAAAGYGAAVLATSAGWVAYSHAAVFDLPLAATFGAAMLSLLGWVERGERGGIAVFAGLLGLSMLAKGLVGPALAALTLGCCAWRLGVRVFAARVFRDFLRPVPVMVFVAVAAPWYALCYARNGNVFLEEFFWKHHFARYLTGALEHHQPVWYFVPVVAVGLLPWTPLVAALPGAGIWRERRAFFLAAWAVVTVVFFSLSRDKLPHYVLPALPAVAALVGIALTRSGPMRAALPVSAMMLALLPAGAAVLPEALDTGIGTKLESVRISVLPVAAVALLAGGVWALERAGRRPAAVAAIALAAVAGYAWIAQDTFPQIERRAGTRALWQQAQARGGAVCVVQTPRSVLYGLSYYAGRKLPSCDAEPQPWRIEGREIISGF